MTRAEQFDRIDVVRMALQKVMLQAYQSDQKFFRGNVSALVEVNYYDEIQKPELVSVIALDAATWLVACPQWRHLAPDTMIRFLKPAPAARVRSILPVATDDEIIAILRTIYASATSPPNLVEVHPLAVPHLAAQGKSATKQRVQAAAEADEFKKQRRKPGEKRHP